MRMAGPGYGWTLGEALVSEGLAGRFTSWLFNSPPEPWEQAVGEDILRTHAPDAAMLQAAHNDHAHAAWFFGVGERLPRWFGYTLGYRIADEWLTAAGEGDGDTWVNVPADGVLAAARRLLGA